MWNLIGPVVSIVTGMGKGFLGNRRQGKANWLDMAENLITNASDSNREVQLTKYQWQAVREKCLAKTWKDDISMWICYSPIIMMIIGAVVDPILSLYGLDYSFTYVGKEIATTLSFGLEGGYSIVFSATLAMAYGRDSIKGF